MSGGVKPEYNLERGLPRKGRLVAAIFVLLILVAMGGACLGFISKRDEASDQLSRVNDLNSQVALKFADTNINSENICNYDKNEFMSKMIDVKSDLVTIENILNDIDRTVLTDSEDEYLEVIIFENELSSDIMDSCIKYFPGIMQGLYDLNKADPDDHYRIKIILTDVISDMESYLIDLDNIENKIVNREKSQNSDEMDKYCSKKLNMIKNMKSDLKKSISPLKETLSRY